MILLPINWEKGVEDSAARHTAPDSEPSQKLDAVEWLERLNPSIIPRSYPTLLEMIHINLI